MAKRAMSKMSGYVVSIDETMRRIASPRVVLPLKGREVKVERENDLDNLAKYARYSERFYHVTLGSVQLSYAPLPRA